MGQWGPTTVSGEGNAPLDTSAPFVSDIQADLLSYGPKTRLIGTTVPRGVRYAAQYGLGYFPGDAWDPPVPYIQSAQHLRWEHQDFNEVSNIAGGVYSPSVWWRCAPGVTMSLTVYW
jgi:hypothetical protein